MLSCQQVSLLYTFWMYCLRLFIVELMFTVVIVVSSLKSMCIQSFILIGCCVSELHGPLCPYHNVLPEAVYCCFTRTTSFTILLFIYFV